ncbi:MAG: hypothetical protein IJ064_02935 [Bacteroidaceae bacterium]|nr:hypothetical protein [Bacteroidaceae bacterium]
MDRLNGRFGLSWFGVSRVPEPLDWMREHVGGRGSTRTQYLSGLNVFRSWAAQWCGDMALRWYHINMELLKGYEVYCRERYSASRYNFLLMVLRMCLDMALEDGKVPFHNREAVTFLHKCHVTTRVKDDGRIALSREQVNLLYALKRLKGNWKVVRDMFVLQCLTSLRFSNLTGADFRAYRNCRAFEIIQKKEKASCNQWVSLDYDSRIGEILERNGWRFPEISLATYNLYVKKLVKRLPMSHRQVKIKTRMANGTIRVESKPFFEAVRSHNGRRTFITELRSNPNVQDRDLAVFTGHKTLALLEVYDKTSKQRRVANVLRAVGKRTI